MPFRIPYREPRSADGKVDWPKLRRVFDEIEKWVHGHKGQGDQSVVVSGVPGPQNAEASGDLTVAVGYHAVASGFGSTAVGWESAANGAFGSDVALGASALASGGVSTALGTVAMATAINATAVGASSTATASNATAVGELAAASGTNALALGSLASATHTSSVALGNGTQTKANGQVVLGFGTGQYVVQSVALSEPADAAIGSGQCVLWFDVTADVLHAKAKKVGGTVVSWELGTLAPTFTDITTDNLTVNNLADFLGDLMLDAGSEIAWNGDTILYRSAADTLKTDDSFVVGDDLTVGDDVTLASGSVLTWNGDTNLYRSVADVLKTDDTIEALRLSLLPTAAVVALSIAAASSPTADLMQWNIPTMPGGNFLGRITAGGELLMRAPDGTIAFDVLPRAGSTGPGATFAVGATASASAILSFGSTGFPGFNSASQVFGLNAVPTNLSTGEIVGISSNPVTLVTGTTANQTGIRALLRLANATGTITNGQAFYAFSPTITSGGVYTNAYGLRIQNQSVTGVTNAYGVYQEGSSDRNHFNGRATGFGLVPNTTAGRIQLPTGGTTEADGITWGDTNLYRSASNTLRTDDSLIVNTDLTINGDMTLGDDATLASGSVLTWASDTNLYRSAADTLKTDDSLVVNVDLTVNGDMTLGDDATLASGSVLTWASDTNLYRSAANTLATDDDFLVVASALIAAAGYVEFQTEIATPANPAANKARLYIKDNGSGKTQLGVRFASGAEQIIATEP